MKARQAGVALTEMLVAVSLFAMAMASMASVYVMAARNQAQAIRQVLVDNDATLVRQALSAALDGASFVGAPGPGSDAAELTAWRNVDPEDGASPIHAPLARTFSHLCIQKDGLGLHLYEGGYPIPQFECGADAGAAVRRTLVAGGPGLKLALRLRRPEREGNVVLADYAVAYAGSSPRPVMPALRGARFTIRHARD